MSGNSGPLLAIDTSTLSAGVALYREGVALADVQWPAGRAQTATLLGEVDHLLALCGLRPADLGAVAVATGPGSFNGLRVGMSTAKGLTFALDLPLLGVPTLEGAAYPHGRDGRAVRPVIAAGRGRYVSAPYRWHAGSLHRLGEYENTTLEGLAALIGEPTIVCGELPPDRLDDWRALAPLAQVASPATAIRRAACLAEIAWARRQRGEVDDPTTLEPVYLHGPVATEPRPALVATHYGEVGRGARD